MDLKYKECVKKLFGGWEETLIWSCLEGSMGDIYVDSPENPGAAMAVLGDFCFFAGTADEALVKYRPKGGQRFMIMIPQNRQWARLIEDVYQKAAVKVERYAIKKETDVFDREYLGKIAGKITDGFSLCRIDGALYGQCMAQPWSRDLVSQFATADIYARHGLGFVALKDGEIVSGASSYSVYSKGIEIEIDTREDYRRKGLALACGARLILECLDRGLYPSWDAQNMASVALAQKLGYHYAGAYDAYEVRWDS